MRAVRAFLRRVSHPFLATSERFLLGFLTFFGRFLGRGFEGALGGFLVFGGIFRGIARLARARACSARAMGMRFPVRVSMA